MPDIEGGIGVSESQNYEFGVDGDDALDVFGFFFDDVGVDGFVGGVANFAFPVEEVLVVVSANN